MSAIARSVVRARSCKLVLLQRFARLDSRGKTGVKLDFSANVSFHRDLNLWVWQPRGILDEPHVERLVDLIDQLEKESEEPFNRYADLSKLDAVNVSFDMSFGCRFIAVSFTAANRR